MDIRTNQVISSDPINDLAELISTCGAFPDMVVRMTTLIQMIREENDILRQGVLDMNPEAVLAREADVLNRETDLVARIQKLSHQVSAGISGGGSVQCAQEGALEVLGYQWQANGHSVTTVTAYDPRQDHGANGFTFIKKLVDGEPVGKLIADNKRLATLAEEWEASSLYWMAERDKLVNGAKG